MSESGNLITDNEETEVFVFPSSFAQARLWFLHQLAPGNPFYNVLTALHLKGSLNLTVFKQTLNQIVDRHEILRTTFAIIDGQPMQVIAPNLTISFTVIDLRHLESKEKQTQARQLANEEAKYPFNLTTGPLLRVTLLQLDEQDYVLLLNIHHIVADGWSIGVLFKELGILYSAFLDDNQSSPLPELPIQYADFAQWQREWLQGVDSPLQNQLAYWREQLDKILPLNLPTDRLRPAIPTFRGRKHYFKLSQYLTQELEILSYREGVTLFMTLLAAFQTLLYRYTQQEEIIIGSPIANRNRSEIEGLIGFFVNNLVLRTNFSGNPTFRELLSRVKKVTLAAYAHQDLPFEKLVEELRCVRDLSFHPLFQVVFSLQNTPIEALNLPGLEISLFEFDSETAKLDLEFQLWQDLDSLQGQVVYSTDLFDDATITRMIGHFQTLLESIAAKPEQELRNLPLLTLQEQQLLIDGNDTKRNYGEYKSFNELFEAQVEKTPDAIALVFIDNQTLTYRELNIQANQIAHYLQQLHVAPDNLVGIYVERSPHMIIGLLGILKAGGAYVPLDPTYPQQRLNFILEDTQISVLLTQEKFLNNFISFSNPIICLDNCTTITQQSQENLKSCVTSDNLAYVIYTSGSTGKPKGVLLEHRGLFNLAKAQIEIFDLQPLARILQFASLSFDASIFEIVMALTTGGTLYLAKKELLLPGQPLLQILRENAITHVTLPPAVLAVLPIESLPALQTIICAGESCSNEVIKRWSSHDRKVFNAYGPTEATVWSTIAEISDFEQKPPIGRPIPNTQIYILDQYLQPVPMGIIGELYISGEGLARGYLNQAKLTAEKFISHPFVDKKGVQLYQTGDLARYRLDGNIEFLGRIDNQVKVGGFRIELSEIEIVLNQHQHINKAVVIAKENASGDKNLVAYIIPNSNQVPTSFELREFLKQKLLEYMVPKRFVIMDSLPLTVNGKVDSAALTKLDIYSSRFIDKTFINPRTTTESTLVKIWAKILNVECISIDDNFFDLGGNSLLSVRLIEEIDKEFSRQLPLSTLFLHPTIENLATCLSEDNSLPWSPLVPIQPAGSNPPFFCVHPIFGVVFPYYQLANHLGKNQPFYGLQPIGLDGETPLTSVEDMATHYIEALRSVQPKGPYFLGGWSFGGWIAFEMAQQLQQSGEEIALLAILDTLAPIKENIPSLLSSFKFLLTTVGQYIWPFFVDYFYLITAKLLSADSRLRILRELAIRPMLRVFYANNKAVRNYVPSIYHHPIHLLRTKIDLNINDKDQSMGWNQLTTKGTSIYVVPGNHLTMLRKPHIKILAAQLKVCIETQINKRQ